MIITVDIREQDLLTHINHLVATIPVFKNCIIKAETLPIGDIIISNETEEKLIIERKSVTDLLASIKDGRYEEQSYRLNGLQHHNHNIIYLIEGDIYRFNTFKERIDKQTLYSAMFSINYFKGFSVMRSNTIDETAMISCNMAYKLVGGLKAGKNGFYSNILTNKLSDDVSSNDQNNNGDDIIKEATEKDYCSVIKKVKKENITPDNIGEIMLCQIPGVSYTYALAILSHFTTLPNLINCINENENCMNNICTTDANGKSRKISKTAIATIVKFLKI
jgi:ERCC4-type nuclease